MRARAVLLASLTLGAAAILSPGRAVAAGWVSQNIWTPPDIARFAEFGPGRNDGVNRIYMPNNNGKLHEATWTGSTWSVVEIGSGTTGWAVGAAAIGAGRNDATQRIYGVSGDSVYEYSWTGSTWTRTTLAIVSGNHPWVTVGSGRNDATNRIYAGHDNNNLYEYTWNGSTWPQTIVASEAGDINYVEVGNGRNDGVQRVYANVITGVNAIFEYTWSGSSWTKVTVGTVGGNVGIRIKDGRGDGIVRVYATSGDTHIYEFTYSGGSWVKTDLGANPATPGRCDIGAARHDAVPRLYSANGSSTTFEWTYSGGWSSTTLILPSNPLWDTRVLAGRNDGVARIYVTGNPVYEVTYDTVAPTVPVGLGVTSPGIGVLLRLSWVANSEGDLKDYGLYRSTTSGGLGSKAIQVRVAAPGTTHQDSSFASGTTYYYQLTARDVSLNESAGSPEVSSVSIYDTTPPTAVTNLVAITQDQIKLTWTAPSDNVGVTAYHVRYSTLAPIVTEGDWSAATIVLGGLPAPLPPGTTQSMVITGLKPRITHWFAIKAEDAQGNLSLDTSSPEPSASAGSFVLAQEPAGPTGPGNGGVAWGDYDNDGDLDMVVKGFDGVGRRFRIYRNDAGVFNLVQEPAGAATPLGDGGSAAWGDYDNDGDLDLAVNGYDGTTFLFRVYRNDGGTFNLVQEPAGASGPGSGVVAWGDYDNDGDLDLAVNGWDGTGRRFRIYRNDGGIFNLAQEPAGTTGPGHLGELAWGDYDNDGDLDLAVGGEDGVGYRFRIYRNDGGTFNLVQEPAGATGPAQQGLAWGDYDNDGDLDLAVSGWDGTNYRFRVYRNDGGTFNLAQEPAGATGPASSVAWGDYDNDGDLDLISAGNDGSGYRLRIYRNDGGTFNLAQEPAGPTGPATGGVAWGDLDNDGDLDLAVNGWDGAAYRFRIYKSLEADYGNTNTAPSPPGSGFSVAYATVTQTLTLMWGAGSDIETAAGGLYYQVRIGTASTQGTRVSGVFGSPLLGSTIRPKTSGSQLGRSLTNVISGTTIYWAVKTIDTGLRASVWSVEHTTAAGGIDTTSPAGPVWGGLSTGTAGRMNIFWVPNTEIDLKDYRVWRGTYNAQFVNPAPYKSAVAVIPQPGTTHQDAGLTDGATYFYQLTARDVNGNESPASSEVSATGGGDTTPPAAPTGLGAAGGTSAVNLSWTANTEGDLKDYGVYRATLSSTLTSKTLQRRIAMPGTTHQDAVVFNGTTYYYQLTARDASLNESGGSSEVSATPSGPPGVTWVFETADSTGVVGTYIGLAVDSAAVPHIGYYDNTNQDARYATKNGGAWLLETVDAPGNRGAYGGLTLGRDGTVSMSYQDITNADLMYARRSGAGWTPEVVDSTGSVGTYTSIAVDGAGNVHIAYYDTTNMDLKYAKKSGGSWTLQTVDSAGDVGGDTGIALDAAGKPYIAYFDATNNRLKMANWTGSAWTIQAVDATGSSGHYPHIVLSASGTIHITHWDSIGQDLRYAQWNGSSWSLSAVDTVGDVGRWPAPALDGAGNVHIAYFDNTNGDLKYARWTGSAWDISTVDSAGVTGQYPSLAIGSDGNPRVAYYDSTNGDLRYARVTAGGGFPQPVQTAYPTGLGATVYVSSITWTWTDNATNEQGYRVRSATSGVNLSGDLAANTVSWTETGLSSATAYTRYVQVYNAGGVANSSPLTATTGDTTPPALPTGFGVANPGTGGALRFSWAANTEGDLKDYGVYMSTASGQVAGSVTRRTYVLAPGTTHQDSMLNAQTTYYFRLTARDTSGNESGATAEVSGVPIVPDAYYPQPPVGFGVTSGPVSNQLRLSWQASAEIDLKDYLVYRSTFSTGTGGMILIASITRPGTTHQDAGLTDGTTYYYRLTARDTSLNQSNSTAEMTAIPSGSADATPPAAITNLTAATQAQVLLTWTAPSDNVGVTGYLIRYSSFAPIVNETDWSGAYTVLGPAPAPLAPGTTQTMVVTGLKPRTTHYFAIKSQDAAGNLSALDTSSPEPGASAGSFVLAQEPAGASGPGYGVAWGDFDNDGDLDLAVGGADNTGYRLRVYRNDGGTFNLVQEPAGASGAGEGLAWGDFDNDGDLDLAAGGYDGVGYRLRVYRNDGGTFNLVQEPAGATGPGHALAWGDFDNDGDLDLAAGGFDGVDRRLRVYRNDGGTFNLVQEPAGVTGPAHALAWGDYDNDGDLDLVAGGTDPVALRLRVYRNDGGIFNLVQEPAGGANAPGDGVAWGDYDNDGDLDLVAGGQDAAGGRLRVYKSLEADFGNVNSAPVAPSGLTSSITGSTATLTWAFGTDTQSPTYGLYYQTRVSTTAGGAGGKWVVSDKQGSPFLGNYMRALTTSPAQGRAILKGLTVGTTYYWAVRTIDTGLRASSWSAEASTSIASGPDTTPPGAVSGLSVSAGTGLVNLTWTANTEGDLKDYRIRQSTVSGISAATSVLATIVAPGTTHRDGGLAGNTTYFYRLSARDVSLNESGLSVEVSTRPGAAGDTTPPAIPTGLTVTQPAQDRTLVMSWSANTEPDFSQYRLYKGTFTGTQASKTSIITVTVTGYTDGGLLDGTTYYFQLVAVDGSANASGPTSEVSGVTRGGVDTTPPAAISDLTALVGASDGQVVLTWTAPGDDGMTGTATTYDLRRDTHQITTPADFAGAIVVTTASWVGGATPALAGTASSTTIAGLNPGVTYYFSMKAADEVGNWGSLAAPANNWVPAQNGPPNAPATPNGTSPGGGIINLYWTANTEADLKDYRIWRATSTGALGTKGLVRTVAASGTTHQDGGLTQSINYFYQLTARDTVGYESGGSGERSIFAGDLVAPSSPTTLGVANPALGGRLNLSWAANTESDLKDYRTWRSTFSSALTGKSSTTAIAAPGTTHQDAGLANGTSYYYQLTARDTSGNESGGSPQSSAYPTGGADTTPPGVPTGFGVSNPGTGGRLNFSWTANTEPDLKDYRIYCGLSSGPVSSKVIIVTILTPGTTHQEGGQTNGTAYYFQVTARDTSLNESGGSAEVSAVPTGATGNYLQVTSSAGVTAGVGFTATVVAKSSAGVTLGSATDTVTLTTSDLYDTEPAARALVNGTTAFPVALVTAGNVTLTATAAGYTAGSATTVVAAGAAAGLQVLLPGEAAVAGKTAAPAGKTGTPISQKSGVAFTATVNAVDAWWNVVSTAPTVTVVTSDPNDNDREPTPAALAAGTRGFLVAPVTLGNVTVTASATGYASATSASVLITNATPPAAPTGLTATPQEGATIRLAWTLSTSADVSSYRIYYATAISLLNFAAPSATVAHPTSSYVTPVLAAGQTYSFVVRAVNASGNEETNANVVTAQALATLAGAVRARVAWPLNGSRVAGARMTVIGEVTAGADRLASIRFDYRPEASSVWTTITPALTGFPNPDGTAPYFIPWDMRSLALGTYRVRAVAADRDGKLDPAAAEVSITHVAPADVDLEDTVTSRGERQVRQVVRRDQDNRIRVGDDRGEVTEVRIPAGALVSSQTVVRVVLNPADASPGQAGLNSLGRTRRISFEDGTTTLRSTFTIRVAFRQDASGNIQGTRATPRALLYCRLNPATGRYQWVPITAIFNATRKRWEDAKGNEITPAATRSGAPALADTAETAPDGTSVVEAETSQDGDYALFIGAAENLDLTLVYPNPFRPNSDATHTDITFANLTEESTIEVLTVAGERVWMKEKVVGRESWSGTNTDGEPVTTGVYVYIITSKEGQKSIGKLAVIR